MRFLCDMCVDVRVTSWLSAQGGRTGVVLFRLRNPRTDFVLKRLSQVIGECEDVLARGAIVIIEETRHRIREFPKIAGQ